MTVPQLVDDIFEQIRQTAVPALSDERETRESVMGMLGVEQDMAPEMRAALTTLYGFDFPLLNPQGGQPSDWVKWAHSRWIDLGPSVQKILHLVERNRLFRAGIQWISSSGYGPWREPPRPRDAARVVENLIAPALSQRVQIVSEQRPGFRVRPTTADPDDMKRAEAKQIGLEYQFDQQEMPALIKEFSYWAGTDGVAFGELHWDAEAGPWHEQMYGQGNPMAQQPQQPKGPMGDVKCRVRRIEQVRVSPNATATRKPWFWVIKEVMSKSEAVKLYGTDVVSEIEQADPSNAMNSYPLFRSGYLLPTVEEMIQDTDRVDRITIYCEKSMGLPQGLTLVVVGDKMVFQGPLLIGVCPMIRWTDGSPDPAFYPTPEMNNWIDSQMRINAVKSKWVENVRLNSGPKLLAKENAISGETMVAANMSVITAKGLGNLNEIVRPMESFSVGNDAKELLALEIQRFEQLSGYNDASRGSFTAEQSGRAILAIREQLERIFSPMINAASFAMTEWAKITCAWMAWGYDYPRYIGVEGRSRPDLATILVNADFDGVADVFIDPETLMPMPRSLRLFLLKDLYGQGLMTPQEYRRRLPFAWTRSIGSPDEDQEARARRVCESLRQGQPLPMKWQDNEAIHQDILDRELILPDDIDPAIQAMAVQRWIELATQAQMKYGMTPPSQPGGSGTGKSGSKGGGLKPQEQPFQGTNPGVAASTGSNFGGQPEANSTARQFDAQQRQMDQGA